MGWVLSPAHRDAFASPSGIQWQFDSVGGDLRGGLGKAFKLVVVQHDLDKRVASLGSLVHWDQAKGTNGLSVREVRFQQRHGSCPWVGRDGLRVHHLVSELAEGMQPSWRVLAPECRKQKGW